VHTPTNTCMQVRQAFSRALVLISVSRSSVDGHRLRLLSHDHGSAEILCSSLNDLDGILLSGRIRPNHHLVAAAVGMAIWATPMLDRCCSPGETGYLSVFVAWPGIHGVACSSL